MGHATGPILVPLCETHREQMYAGVVTHSELLEAAISILQQRRQLPDP